ncbi:MAG: hypothetical protein ACREML_11860, partial [Vulcanimicrobiaceae bacterium]
SDSVRRLFVSIFALVLISAVTYARAEAGTINSFTTICSGNISYDVTDDTHTRLPGSQSCTFSLNVTTDANQGAVTLTAPKIKSTDGAKISQNAFWATCSANSDPSGIFSSIGLVQLGTGAVTCATISSHATNKTVSFSVTLYLDDTPDSSAFPGDPAYASANLKVTASAP